MGLFNQFSNVVEWKEPGENEVFWKWSNEEIKKGSKLIIRPGQDAIFLYNGKREGVFSDEGSFDIESQIIPFLSTLKGFKFGFNSGMRAEVLFVNTKEFTVKWGTKQPVNIPNPQLPGGMPIRAMGTFNCKVSDYLALIDKIAGVKQHFTIEEVRDRVLAVLDSLLMKWIMQEGKDMFNLQANAIAIGNGIQEDLDMELSKIGFASTGFSIQSFNYPEEIQKMVNKVAGQSMVGDVGHYQQVSMVDGMSSGNMSGGGVASDMAGMMMGMQMGMQMANQMTGQNGGTQTTGQNMGTQQAGQNVGAPKFCPECGSPTNGAKFCGNCGNKLV